MSPMRSTASLVAVVFGLFLGSGCGQASAPAGRADPAKDAAGKSDGSAAAHASASNVLKEGDPAPDVTLTLASGSDLTLSSLKGKLVLVYFYPKDDTPGCTIEAKGIKDGWTKFREAGVEVYGVSMQNADSHKAFSDKYSLPYPLVTDEAGKVADAFHVPHNGEFASRQSFLIGKDGTIK